MRIILPAGISFMTFRCFVKIFVFDVEKEAIVNQWASHAMPVRSISWSGDGSVSTTCDTFCIVV